MSDTPVAFPGPKTIEEKVRVPEPRWTLAEAFDYFHLTDEKLAPDSNPLNQERAVRAVAFLLHYMSQHSNMEVAGAVANGLAEVLEHAANGMGEPVWLTLLRTNEQAKG